MATAAGLQRKEGFRVQAHLIRARATNMVLVASALALAACASPARPAPSSGPEPTQSVRAPQGRLVIGFRAEPNHLGQKWISNDPGYTWIFNSPLAYYDEVQKIHKPLMVEQLPSPENGDWVINADGSMVTTYRLKENIRWHDGVPLTAHDFVFAHQVYQDPEVGVHDLDPERWMSGVEARDDRTLAITWSQPYLDGNRSWPPPLPRHQLEEK